MNLQITQGYFDNNEAIHLLSEMIAIKIRFHEKKIGSETNLEDIKMRENRIKKLQNDLAIVKSELQKNDGKVTLNCQINIS